MKNLNKALTMLISTLIIPTCLANGYFIIANKTHQNIEVYGRGVYDTHFYAGGMRDPDETHPAVFASNTDNTTYSTSHHTSWQGDFYIKYKQSVCHFHYADALWLAGSTGNQLLCQKIRTNENTYTINAYPLK